MASYSGMHLEQNFSNKFNADQRKENAAALVWCYSWDNKPGVTYFIAKTWLYIKKTRLLSFCYYK